MTSPVRSTVVLDSHSLIFRSFWALSRAAPAAPDDALRLFRRFTASLVEDLRPQYLLAAADNDTPSFRSSIDPDYKASRSAPPTELKQLIPLALEAVRSAGIPVVTCDGYEADDVIGTFAERVKPGHHLTIVSSDRDLAALVGERVSLYIVMSNGKPNDMITLNTVDRLFGVPAHRVCDYKALVGDTSDNISGVRGIGPKTAKDLISRYGSLDEILAAQDLPAAVQRKLDADGRAAAQVSYQLARIATDAPVQFDPAALRLTAQKLTALRP